jgi:hypothetical protein
LCPIWCVRLSPPHWTERQKLSPQLIRVGRAAPSARAHHGSHLTSCHRSGPLFFGGTLSFFSPGWTPRDRGTPGFQCMVLCHPCARPSRRVWPASRAGSVQRLNLFLPDPMHLHPRTMFQATASIREEHMLPLRHRSRCAAQ